MERTYKHIKSLLIRHFWLLLVLGILVRLIFAGISAWNYDVRVWHQFAFELSEGIEVYSFKNFSYPPGAAAILSVIVYPLIKFVPSELWGGVDPWLYKLSVDSWLFDPLVTSPIFNYILKLPLLIAEIIIVYSSYLVYRDRIGENNSKLFILLFYLNPLVLFISAIHGQLDILPLLFLYLSFLLLISRRSYIISGIMFGISISFKMFPLFILPSIVILILSNKSEDLKSRFRSLKNFIIGLLPPIMLMAIYFFFNRDAYVSVFRRFGTLGFEGSLNIGFINYIPSLWPLIQNNSIALVNIMTGLLLISLILFNLFLFIKVVRKTKHSYDITYYIVIICSIIPIYLFSQRTNPNYLLWIMPFVTYLTIRRILPPYTYVLFTFAGLLFYLGINALSYKVLFFPMATYLNLGSVGDFAQQFTNLYSATGLLNKRLMYDVFLISAVIFAYTCIDVYYRLVVKLGALNEK